MILIISATNRANSMTSKVSMKCKELLERSVTEEVQLLDLANVENFGLSSQMYSPDNQSEELRRIQDDLLKKSSKWILVLPEYNGGLPGIFKLFIDAVSIRDKDETFRGRHAALIGVAAGRAGNLRGLDYLTNCLNYLGMHVHSNKLPISSLGRVYDSGEMDEGTSNVLDTLLMEFCK